MDAEGVNSFERFSLRAARTLLVWSIMFGSLAIAVGLVVAGGAWLVPGPTKPKPEAAPAPAKFTLADADRWAGSHSSELREIEQSALSLSDPGVLPSSMAPLFPDPPYTTTDVWEDYCRSPSEYGCLQRGKRIKQPSVARTFTALFHEVDTKRRDELLAVLAEHLPGIPAEKRLSMVVPILMAHLQVQKKNKEAADAHEARLAEAESSFEAATSAHTAEKGVYSLGGLTAAGWGLGWVISASVFVALLAIERHLRELRRTGAGRPEGTT